MDSGITFWTRIRGFEFFLSSRILLAGIEFSDSESFWYIILDSDSKILNYLVVDLDFWIQNFFLSVYNCEHPWFYMTLLSLVMIRFRLLIATGGSKSNYSVIQLYSLARGWSYMDSLAASRAFYEPTVCPLPCWKAKPLFFYFCYSSMKFATLPRIASSGELVVPSLVETSCNESV